MTTRKLEGALNRQVLLASRPAGIPQAHHFSISQSPIPKIGQDQVLVRNEWLSVEPAMRGWVNAAPNYMEPVAVGAVMRSFTAGRIVDSNAADWPVGTLVTGLFGWQDYAAVDTSSIQRRITEMDLPLSTSLGVLGLNGVTAHYGLLRIGRPAAGETVVVSTAAGSVGSIAGQIAKLMGCRTVAIAGGPAKCALCLEHFGFDAAVDYKAAGFVDQLSQACRGGVDIYFDNTSGQISDAVMRELRPGARVVVCGTSAMANWDPWPQGPRVERHLLVKRARMEGFVIFDHPKHEAIAREDLARWLRAGDLRYAEDILDGIEYAPDAIAGLYRGDNLGKRLIRLN